MWLNAKLRLLILAICGLAITAPAVAFAATNVQTLICSPFNPPSITAPATGTTTNSPSIHVVGYGEPGLVVRILKNGVGIGAIAPGTDGSYAISVPLDTGANLLAAHESNDCGTTKVSSTIQATRTTDSNPAVVPAPQSSSKPVEITNLTSAEPLPVPATQTLSPNAATPTSETKEQLTPAQKEIIAEPKHNEEISSERTWVTGKTTSLTKVDIYVNKAIAASVTSDTVGIYSALVNMKPGKNTIQVQATATDGSVITVRTIDVQLVKKETAISREDKMDLKNARDTVGLIIIAAIGLGGALIISTILWHTYRLKGGKKPHA